MSSNVPKYFLINSGSIEPDTSVDFYVKFPKIKHNKNDFMYTSHHTT